MSTLKIKNKKTFIESAIVFEQYFGLSLNTVEFSLGRPWNLRASNIGKTVSILIIILLAHCIYVTFKFRHEKNSAEVIFDNSMSELIRPIMHIKMWIHFSKWGKFYELVLIRVPQRLRSFRFQHDWLIDGLLILLTVTLILISMSFFYLVSVLIEKMEKYGHFPENHWQQAIVFSPIIYRLTLGKLVMRLSIVIKEFKMLEKELERFYAIHQMK